MTGAGLQAIRPVAVAVTVALSVVMPALPSTPATAQGQLLAACSRGKIEVCFALLARPRLDAGRRAAIEFHLAELEKLIVACTGGDAAVCDAIKDRYPELPSDLMQRPLPPVGAPEKR